MRKVFIAIVALFILTVHGFASGGSEASSEDSGTIKMWGWLDAAAYETTEVELHKVYPEIDIDYLPVQAYEAKFQVSLASGSELPDVFWSNRTVRDTQFKWDMLEDLRQQPYYFNTGDVFDFMIPQVTDFEGKVVLVPWDLASSGLAYRKDLTMEYFGVEDPADLERMLPDWESFYEKGLEVTANSDGQVYMFASISAIIQIVTEQNPIPFSEGAVINLTQTIDPALEIAVRMRDAGMIDVLEDWTPAWGASFAGGKHIFYRCPMWMPNDVIAPNDVDGYDRWGLMKAPEGGYTWVGTAMGIPKQSKNKSIAWKFIEWYLLSETGAHVIKDTVGFFSHYKSAYDDPSFMDWKVSQFGDQNIGAKFFGEINKETFLRPVDWNDAAIGAAWSYVALELTNNPDLDIDKAKAMLREELSNRIEEDVSFR